MSRSPFPVRGALAELPRAELARLFDRAGADDDAVRERAAAIVARVRAHGDAALRALARELDGVELDALCVPRERWRRALDALDVALRRALERAAANIARVHAAHRPSPVEVEVEPGVVVGRRPDPLDAVGVYVPGGRAAYPSSLLMGVVPAVAAGVQTVIVCSPPGADGAPAAIVLAAAELAAASRLFALGGAGAIAAMAYGTETVPRVQRIVGPGNAYVAAAKLLVSSAAAIDSPAGPSELLVLADRSAASDAIAREVIAQAEHDPRAAVVVVTDDERAAVRIERALCESLGAEPRGEIAAAALASRGALLWSGSMDASIDFANRYAPEHLLLAVANADAVLPRVRNAGTVFLGETSSVAFGDYITGANHVLPTGGLARSYSGLSTLDFVRWTTWQRVSREGAADLARDVGLLAVAEGLPAHATTARAWEPSR